MSNFPYLHGFSKDEQNRLRTQARFAEYSVYKNIDLSRTKNLIEVGCGVGAQTEILLRRFPELKITGIDLNARQLESAHDYLDSIPHFKKRYQLYQMNAEDMTFQDEEFDGAFLCWILEHVPNPTQVLSETRRVLKPGSHIYVTEVLNSSFFLDPYSPNVWKYWMAYNDYQYENAGDPFIGAKLGNLLTKAGFKDVKTKVVTWHYDNRLPKHRKETIEFWRDLLLSGSEKLIEEGQVTKEIVENVKKELDQVAKNPDAVFFYSFMQAKATVY